LLLKGPTGTGKELLARTIHSLSPRAAGPFVVLPCGAIPDSLFEAELFGVRKGAFTGADSDTTGIFVQAQGGTLLIDGVSQLSLSQQTKLLRVLQDRSITPLGSDETVPLDLRILATTQVDLENAVALGSFREDLFHRLRVLEIDLPALRERRSDIPDLAQWTLTRLSRQYRKPKLQLPDDVLEKLLHHTWPGNIRELENSLEHAASMAWGEGRTELSASDLPDKVQWASMSTQDHDNLKDATKRFEREYIQQLLKRNGGNKEEAAEILGLSLATLYRKLAA
jgi:transcriptional regulator with PAS, ATPase and Fis domain